MIQVACRGVVRLIAITVVGSTGSLPLATAGRTVVVHLIGTAYPRCLGRERAVRAEIHGGKRAPAVVAGKVVDHDIRYGTCVLGFQPVDERTQVRFASPGTVQIAVLHGDVARSATRLRAGRQPHEVEVLADLIHLAEQCAPARVAVRKIAAVGRVAVPVKRLQHHIRSIIRYTRSLPPHRCAHQEHKTHR